ncbi:MAG TPA: chemotaxis protein CheC [Myxococcota bacterium]|nr:chemotaxis protein CheC [Myxococcota bacterium]
MSTRAAEISESEVDRLRELAHIGASWAAGAFARLVERTILTRVPVVYGPERFRRRGEWETGILCDLSGDLSGLVAILMSSRTRESVIRLLCGVEQPPREIAASALTEFGNILVSQTASAVADTLGGRILPSLPELVFSDAETALQVRMSPRRCPDALLYIESELFDRAGEFRALHVMVPRVVKESPAIRPGAARAARVRK